MTTNQITENKIFEIIKWWERKRLFYSISLIPICALRYLIVMETLSFNEIFNWLLLSAIWIFGANIFYCSGWVIEILVLFYFRRNEARKNKLLQLFDNYRTVFLIFGIIISIIWTWVALIWN